MDSITPSQEYMVSISTDDIEEAIRSLASTLYVYVEEALVAHEDHDVEECEFDAFAHDLLGVLIRHAEQLSSTREGDA